MRSVSVRRIHRTPKRRYQSVIFQYGFIGGPFRNRIQAERERVGKEE
jgi:hypothetical protein